MENKFINKKQTEMVYWDMSKRDYRDIESLTDGTLNDISYIDIEEYYHKLKIQNQPNSTEEWDIVRVLDDKETDTQALAFKKGDEIVIAYRGSQELKDWIDTDSNYLVLNS